jgi:small subunit ribosomal protein S18
VSPDEKALNSCFFCRTNLAVDFKDPEILAPYLTAAGKLLSRRESGLCDSHQAEVTTAVKRARELGLVPK